MGGWVVMVEGMRRWLGAAAPFGQPPDAAPGLTPRSPPLRCRPLSPQDATHFRRAQDPATGKEILEPCSPGDAGAFEATLQVGGGGGGPRAAPAGRSRRRRRGVVLSVFQTRQQRSDPDAPPERALLLQTLADKGLAEKVLPPKITFRDFEKVGAAGGAGAADRAGDTGLCCRSSTLQPA